MNHGAFNTMNDAKHSEHNPTESGAALRVKALEAVLIEKGVVDATALDTIVDTYESKVGPRNGARVVARAWIDPAFMRRLLADATAAVAELDIPAGPHGEQLVALANTPRVHNLIVCTLCSCYPWSVLGLPPPWYKSFEYRSRVISDPRAVLREFGLVLPPDVEIRVWDSSAEIRYMALPMRPAGSADLNEQELASLVTRDSMIGTGIIKPVVAQ